MRINKQLIIDSINNTTTLDNTIEKQIDNILDNIQEEIEYLKQKYNINVYINYTWDYKEEQ